MIEKLRKIFTSRSDDVDIPDQATSGGALRQAISQPSSRSVRVHRIDPAGPGSIRPVRLVGPMTARRSISAAIELTLGRTGDVRATDPTDKISPE
jgi:hypothetical protein